jgi:hypothetical protein
MGGGGAAGGVESAAGGVEGAFDQILTNFSQISGGGAAGGVESASGAARSVEAFGQIYVHQVRLGWPFCHLG